MEIVLVEPFSHSVYFLYLFAWSWFIYSCLFFDKLNKRMPKKCCDDAWWHDSIYQIHHRRKKGKTQALESSDNSIFSLFIDTSNINFVEWFDSKDTVAPNAMMMKKKKQEFILYARKSMSQVLSRVCCYFNIFHSFKNVNSINCAQNLIKYILYRRAQWFRLWKQWFILKKTTSMTIWEDLLK